MIDYMVVGPAGVEHRRGEPGDLPAAAGQDAFVWAAFDAPDVPGVAAALEALGLHRLGAHPGLAPHRRPKVELTGRGVMLLVKTVWYIEATRQVETGDLALYTDGRALVTVRRGVVDPAEAVRGRLDDADFRSGGVAGVVQALFDAVVEEYDGAVEDLTDDVGDLEQAVFSGQRVDRNQDIYFLIRETLEFQNAVRPLIPLAHMIKEHRTGHSALEGGRMREVAGRLIRVDGAIETCMSLLTTVLTAHQGQIGTWQNDDMKKISAWAAIAVVPTAIAGVYGMNFEYMPELRWRFGYPAVMVLMALVCFLLYRGFKRNGWLLCIDGHESQWDTADMSEGRDRGAVPALRPCLPSPTP
ncbi:magnesium and cobalt transport protein CorA [Glycomyces sp. A-F 0318]|uniref:magnesium and cobalt transport protein CorA n=1 Tax=Glycomyces amatae TaxID=2881355 RepID=UPI001E330769|nr:magnesium and cobalt transport protein CorA [Glycomyces amatae]MCD0443925.1 magnesium and cobalt transport protein CorA [Glycomyces amatae]